MRTRIGRIDTKIGYSVNIEKDEINENDNQNENLDHILSEPDASCQSLQLRQ